MNGMRDCQTEADDLTSWPSHATENISTCDTQRAEPKPLLMFWGPHILRNREEGEGSREPLNCNFGLKMKD